MTYIYTIIHIRKPIEQVFDYVTTPDNWPQWHPSSEWVNGEMNRSLQVGEQVTEAFAIAGRRERVVWTVREYQAPRRWMIGGLVKGNQSGRTITYTLSSRIDGTTLEREFIYSMPGPLLALLDWLILRRRVETESHEALRRLKMVLEGYEYLRKITL